MKALLKVCGIVACMVSMSSYAEFSENQSTNIDLAGLKAKCVELSGNQQLKPFNAVISCSTRTTFWKLIPSANYFKMKNYMEFGVSARMKSYQMPYQTLPYRIDDTQAPCVTLEKWTRTVPAIEVELNCEKLMTVSSFLDICKPVIDSNLAENPSLAVEEKADEVFNSCDHSMMKK